MPFLTVFTPVAMVVLVKFDDNQEPWQHKVQVRPGYGLTGVNRTVMVVREHSLRGQTQGKGKLLGDQVTQGNVLTPNGTAQCLT